MRLVIAALLLLSGSVRADDVRDVEARALYLQGKQAFEARRYQNAYDLFRQSYLTSQRAALLFNMASCLQELDRPREAADQLRTYLRIVSSDPDRQAIEERIVALDEKQRLLNAALVVRPPPKSRRRLALGLGIAGALVATAIALGLGVGLSATDYRASTLGTHPVTR
jgi:tetratricopeptide (TPR) repeat protein